VFGRRRGAICGLCRNRFAGFAFGVAFLKFRELQIVARNFEVALAHIEARCGLGEVEIFRRAIPISARPHPKSEFAYGFAIRHFATHKMQHETEY